VNADWNMVATELYERFVLEGKLHWCRREYHSFRPDEFTGVRRGGRDDDRGRQTGREPDHDG
jgi:hypothetical protein